MVFGFGEGKIEIFTEKKAFAFGDVIKGRLALELKKPKKARSLRIVVRQTETYYSRDSRGHSEQNTRTLYEFKQDLDTEKEYGLGRKEYPFELPLPQKPVQQMPEGVFGAIANIGAMLSNKSIKWQLDASLDVPGLDINKKMDITVS